jgi:CubicO group peptidase (beta-lactamase class C family)
VLTPDLESAPGELFQAEMRRRFPLTRTVWGNARIPEELLATIDEAISDSDLLVVSTLARLVYGQNAAAMPESHRKIFDRLLASYKPLIWVAFGNPYIFQLAPQVGTYVCSFSYSDVSQIAAAKALAGEIGIAGRMPVSIPGYFAAGDGLTVPKLDMTLKPASAAELSISKINLEAIPQLLNSIVKAGTFPGAALVVGYQGKIVLHHTAGKTGYSNGALPTARDTIYDIASLSKIVVLSPAVMLAADSKSLILEAPVADYIPEMKDTDTGKLPLQDLWKVLENTNGDRTEATEDLLKSILSRATGMPPERFLAERLFKPLGMKNTFPSLPANFRGGIAYFQKLQNAGPFCSAQDLAVFAQMLLNRGMYNHRRYFNLGTIDKFSGLRSLWSKPSISDWTGRVFSPAAFGHTAASGSLLWIDPAKKLFIVLLANGRLENERISEAQRNICESILAAIPD